MKEVGCGELVELFEIIKQCLFIAQVEIMSEMVMHSLILAVDLLQIETPLSLVKRPISDIFYDLSKQMLLVLRHHFIQKLLIFELITLFLPLLLTFSTNIHLSALLLRK